MTYLAVETSPHDGRPIELYKFEGTYENYYYTTAARKITYGVDDEGLPIVYLPIPMERTEISAGTQDDDGLDITIELPVSAGLILVYGFEAAPPTLNLTIYRYHSQAEVITYWQGPVAQITTNDGIGTVQSVSELGTALAADFPNVYYQGPCNNNLFDRRCKVIEANYSGTANVTAANGTSIAVDAIPSGAGALSLDGLLVGGEFQLASGERRMIVSQVGVVINVNFPFSVAIKADDVVQITAGCDHGYQSDCKVKFTNQKNFGGFPFISEDNPFTDGIDDGQVLTDHTCVPEVYDGDKTIVSFYHVVSCNPAYTPVRNLAIPTYQPNAPHGKTLLVLNSLVTTDIYEFDDYINPQSAHYQDPEYINLRGQKILSAVCGNQTIELIYYATVAPGDYHLQIQYPAFYCGSVGLDHGTVAVKVCRKSYNEDQCFNINTGCVFGEPIILGDIGGNYPYDFYWNI